MPERLPDSALDRNRFLEQLAIPQPWDVIVIGGGATGLGTALDAASRGFRTLLLEQEDFAKGTSSRSTKLVHGGVRYLAQGEIGLVYGALYERGLLMRNAPHLVRSQAFVIPCYSRWEKLKYGIGLRLYDWMSGRFSVGRSRLLNKAETLKRLPGIREQGLSGGVLYYDAQFDDARLAINLAQTCAEQGGVVLNYIRVQALIKNEGKVAGVRAKDVLRNVMYDLQARAVINATGVFVDDILLMDDPTRERMVRPSQGIHVVLGRHFLDTDTALMIPKTTDGRVLFAIPWQGYLLVGTTDTALDQHALEPVALQKEVDFIFHTVGAYLNREPVAGDVLSVFAGLRPLAAPRKNSSHTKEISRAHKLMVSDSGLITITGGKWTTYRRMAEDTVDRAIREAGLPAEKCKTEKLALHGHTTHPPTPVASPYGADAERINRFRETDPRLSNVLSEGLPYIEAEVVWAARQEMAMTVEDVLARRLRILFLDARAAIAMAPRVADILGREGLGDETWKQQQLEQFNKLARNYIFNAASPT